MALILLNSRGMRTILYVLGIALSLCTLAPAAMAACPLSAGNTTTWTIDSASTDEAKSTCLENSGGDCALSAVVTRINEQLFLQSQCKTELENGSLKSATLQLKFKNTLTEVKEVQLVAGLEIKIPRGLGHFIIDGSLGNDAAGKPLRVAIKGGALTSLLTVTLVKQGPADIIPDVQLHNLEFVGGHRGLTIEGGEIVGASATIKNMAFLEQDIQGLVLHELRESPVKIASLTAALSKPNTYGVYVWDSTLAQGSQFSDFSITGTATGTTGVYFTQSESNGLTVAGYTGSGIDTGVTIITGTYKEMTFDHATLTVTGQAFYSHGKHSGLQFLGSTLQGPSSSNKATTLLHFEPTVGGTQNNITIKNCTLKNAVVGVHAIGSVKSLDIQDSRISNIEQPGLLAERDVAGIAPDFIGYHALTFQQVSKPVEYIADAQETYSDGDTNVGAVNFGLDTPKHISVMRDHTKPQWIQVRVKQAAGIEALRVYWTDGTFWHPMKTEAFTKECPQAPALCTYTAETVFDAGHFLTPNPYKGQAIENLQIAVAVVRTTRTSMLSTPVALAFPNWKVVEILDVDTAQDAVANQNDIVTNKVCTTKPLDCSLRGAVSLAKYKRNDLHQLHPIIITFLTEIDKVGLDQSLEIDVPSLGILPIHPGPESARPVEIVPTAATVSPLLKLVGKYQSMFNMQLNGKGTIDTLLYSQGAKQILSRVRFSNVKGSAIIYDNSAIVGGGLPDFEKVPGITVRESKFMKFGNHAIESVAPNNTGFIFHTDNTYVKENLLNTVTDLVQSKDFPPVMDASVSFDTVTREITIFANFPALTTVDDVDVYVSFSLDSPITLQPLKTGILFKETDKKFHVIADLPSNLSAQDLLSLGEMHLYIVGHENKPADQGGELPFSSQFSAGLKFSVDLKTMDTDGDTLPDLQDNAPKTANKDQLDADKDGVGDVEDPDLDGDGFENTPDNCAAVVNPDQTNTDGDLDGDACDSDDDGDGFADADDNCPFNANPEQATLLPAEGCVEDLDQDGVRDDKDNCVGLANADQQDHDGDAQGDACDADDDNDTVPDTTDSCALMPNTDQLNTDSDAQGDACDADDDNDTVADIADSCSLAANPAQGDADGDGIGDECDPQPQPAVPVDDEAPQINALVEEPATPADDGGGCQLRVR